MAENQDRYEIREMLGQGAMGVVYRAWDTALNRLVALKVMATSLSSNAELRIRFYREARSAAQLTHPNIVTVYDFGETANKVFIAMELVDGKSLKEAMTAPMALDQKLNIMLQICRALAFAHQNGVVHRDVKPGNMLVTNDQVVKILDFGVAHLASSELTQTGTRLGTPEYMSPEMIEGEKVDHRSDIFSCGIVFYELLTGVKPFYDSSLTALMDKIMSRQLPPISRLAANVPPGLDAIIEKMLQKKPAQRYQSLDEAVADLKELQAELLLVKVDRIRELKALYQGLLNIQSEVGKDEFCRSIFDLELGQELKEAKESLRVLSDPSHTTVTLQALDSGKAALQQRTEKFRTFASTVLPERIARRDQTIEQLKTHLKKRELEGAERVLGLLQEQGCTAAFLKGWRQEIRTAREEQALSRRGQPAPVPPPSGSGQAGPAAGASTRQPQAGSAALNSMVSQLTAEAWQALRKKDYVSCRKNLKRILQMAPTNEEALEMLRQIDQAESGEATVMASWEQLQQQAEHLKASPTAAVAPPHEEHEEPVEEPAGEPSGEPSPTRRPFPKLALIIGGGAILLVLLISGGLWVLKNRGAGQDQLTALDQRISRAITEQSYKNAETLPPILQDIRALAAVEGGQSKADGYLTTVRESYLNEARSREVQNDWQGALKNYQILAGQLQLSEYESKVREIEGLVQASAGSPTSAPGTQVEQALPAPVTKARREPSEVTALDKKIGEAMKAGDYAKPEALPLLLQDIRKLSEKPGGNQKGTAYMAAVQAFYLNEAKRFEAAGDRRKALEGYRVLIDTIGVSEFQAKAAELSRLLESESVQKEAEAIEGRIVLSLKNQNLLPPSRDNAWDLVGQLQKIDPDNPRVNSTKTAIRQQLETRVSEAVDGNRFSEAVEQLKKLAAYFPEQKSRWDQRESDVKKTFNQKELVFPARHIHSGSEGCTGELHLTSVSIRYSTTVNRNHSRSLAFGAISRIQQVSDRLTVTLKMGAGYDFQYLNAADAKTVDEWLKFRDTLKTSP